MARLAGLRSPEEMLELSRQDPAAYVAEQARQQQVHSMIAGLQNQWQQEQFRAQQDRQRSLATEFRALLGCAGAEGHRQAQAAAHFLKTVSKDYGISQDRFATLNDPAVVMVMKRRRGLPGAVPKEKSEVTQRLRLHRACSQKSPVPRADTQDKKRVEWFRSGRGSRDDRRIYRTAQF